MKRWDMKHLRLTSIGALIVMVTGCAVAPSWNHPTILEPNVKASRLTKDNMECTLASEQYQVSVPPSNAPQTFTATGRSYNPQTGMTTTSHYTGQVGGPSGGFAGGFSSGFSNGAAIGAAIRAARIQDMAYRYCMTSRGWIDENTKLDSKLTQPKTEQVSVSVDSQSP